MIIYQTLYRMFPLDSVDLAKIAPVPATDFMHRVLVPEAGVALVQEDMDIDAETALQIVKDSSSYGLQMFPVLDKDDDESGVADNMLRERARARRKEIEGEDDLDLGDMDKPFGKARKAAGSKATGGKRRKDVDPSFQGVKDARKRSNKAESALSDVEKEEWGTTTRSMRSRKGEKPSAISRSATGLLAASTGVSTSSFVSVTAQTPKRPRPRPAYSAQPSADGSTHTPFLMHSSQPTQVAEGESRKSSQSSATANSSSSDFYFPLKKAAARQNQGGSQVIDLEDGNDISGEETEVDGAALKQTRNHRSGRSKSFGWLLGSDD